MNIIDAFIEEFKHESVGTRQTLERVPEKAFNWKPHDKSMTLGRLASHVAEIPIWGIDTLNSTEFNIDMATYKPWQAATTADLVRKFDEVSADLLKAMAGYPNDKLFVPWSLKADGKPLFTLPRIVVLRSMIFNHAVHHRAQLGVYLRMNNVPVPSLYGPSADEQPAR